MRRRRTPWMVRKSPRNASPILRWPVPRNRLPRPPRSRRLLTQVSHRWQSLRPASVSAGGLQPVRAVGRGDGIGWRAQRKIAGELSETLSGNRFVRYALGSRDCANPPSLGGGAVIR